MARARVTLQGSLSHTGKGRTFRKGFPQIISNPAEIQYYQSQSSFHVTILDKAPPKKAAPPAETPSPPPQDDEDDEGEEETENDENEEDGGGDPLPVYSRDKLKNMKKIELMDLAEGWGVGLKGTEKKSKLVSAILKAQKDQEGEE